MKVITQGNLDVYEEIIHHNFRFVGDLTPSSYWLILNFDDMTYSFVKYDDPEFKELDIVGFDELEIMIRKKKIEDLIK